MNSLRQHTSSFRRTAGFILALFAMASWTVAGEVPPAVDRAWDLKLADQPSGSFTESTVAGPDGNVTTKERMVMEINRLGSKVSITNETETVENRAGEMQSLVATMSSSQASTRLRVTRSEEALQIVTEAGGKSYEKKVPFAGTIVGPKGIEKLSREKLQKDGATISYRMFSPEVGNVVKIERKVIGTVDDNGRKLLKCEETIEGFPGKQTVTIDENGRWVTRQQTFPFGELVIEPRSRAATAQASAPPTSTTLPKESYDRTMARSNILLPDPRSISAITLRVRHLKPELGWPDMEGAGQRIVEKSSSTVVLEMRRRENASGQADDKPDESCLRPNALVQSDDAEVIRIAREVTANVEGDFEKARRLQNWVSQNLEFDLGIALASASEVVRNRRGTCVAYAVLLAALERAAGLPSRVVMGFAYANGIWGGHAWTEVYLDNRWIALDSALFSPGPADAARLRFGASPGDDQLIKILAAGAQLYGNVECQVTAFELNGRTIKVPEKTARYQIAGRRYSNPWLGFSLEAPDGFRFTTTDAVFPDRTIVALEGPQARKITVTMTNLGADADAAVKTAISSLGDVKPRAHKIGPLNGEMASSPKAARLVWRQGNSLWVLTAEGDSPDKLLEQIAATWRWTS
ncbi:MAG TPA: transglutaminase-like domain-containing protein [Chthoniobacterales bacterium]|nr:transglutaminase-like domain-containing protein [Chthoniobacterales bacterium]